MADNNSFNDPFGSRGIAAAEQRVRNRNNMARQYTRMSNGGNAPSIPPPPAVNGREKSAEGSPVPTSDNPPQQKEMTSPRGKASPMEIMLPFGKIDTERLMLIMLIALLSSEGADFVLIAALIYVMM